MNLSRVSNQKENELTGLRKEYASHEFAKGNAESKEFLCGTPIWWSVLKNGVF